MKTNNTVLILIVVLILGAVIFYFGKNNTQKSQRETQKVEKQQKNVFSSIKDAITRSLSLKCEYKTPSGNVTAYVKGKSIRFDGFYSGKSKNGTIIKDKKMWTLDFDKKEGTIIPLIQNKNNEKPSDEKLIEDLEKEKRFCKVAIVADSMFIPPKDIKFNDLTSLFENLNKNQ